MKFTIITPNFNGSEYIEDCIRSVSRQNVVFEHIIIDGSSTDSSLDILKKYPHLIVVSEDDNGMYDAINKGLIIAKGEFISYLNVDDRYAEGALLRVENEFENDINLDYVYGDCRLINHLGDKLYIYRVPAISKSILSRITVIPWAQPSVIYKKKVFDKIGNFDINYLLASDYHFMKRVILSELTGLRVTKVLSEFMKRNDSLSSKYLDQMNVEVLKIKNELQLPNHYLLDLFFNIYRKFYNFQTFFKKR